MRASRRAVLRAGAVAGAGAVAVGRRATATEASTPPVVDHGADRTERNLRIWLTVLDSNGEPLADEPVVLQDRGGTPDDRRGRTGPNGRIVFVESVGPPPCNSQRVVLPERDHTVRLGCNNGGRSLSRTIRVGERRSDPPVGRAPSPDPVGRPGPRSRVDAWDVLGLLRVLF